MKKLIFYAWVAACAFCVFTACSDDDDSKKSLSVNEIIGTYSGVLQTLGTSVPNTQIVLSKVDDRTVKLELKDFAFGDLPIGDISANCAVTPDTDDLNLNGSSQVAVAALGDVVLPVVVNGEADGNTLDVDITVSNIPGIGSIQVDYEGRK